VKPWSYYQHWLERVSRSFALCIPQLAPPLRDQVALAYLLFRVLDTVEDAPFVDRDTQQEQFERLRAFLRTPPTHDEALRFTAAFPAGLTEGEHALLGETLDLLHEGHALPVPARGAVFRSLDRMALGMAAYSRRPTPLRLIDVDDVARYCCFVAGVVGEMLTQLWALDRNAPGPRMPFAYHFGLFLQKVNILKDQEEDEAAGRFLVPDRPGLLASVASNAQGALQYLHAIPCGDPYRIFCAWSLMLGAATIAQLDLPRQGRRAETAQLLARIADIVDQDDALEEQLAQLMPPLPDAVMRAPMPKPESFAWFRHTLAAPLTDAELDALMARPAQQPRLVESVRGAQLSRANLSRRS
jgi:phytoene/squalene synthetase